MPVGEACCFDDGHCEFTTVEACREAGGYPQGVGTTCETITCQTTPVQKTTWGRIKGLFR
jgi:hypothetical protein